MCVCTRLGNSGIVACNLPLTLCSFLTLSFLRSSALLTDHDTLPLRQLNTTNTIARNASINNHVSHQTAPHLHYLALAINTLNNVRDQRDITRPVPDVKLRVWVRVRGCTGFGYSHIRSHTEPLSHPHHQPQHASSQPPPTPTNHIGRQISTPFATPPISPHLLCKCSNP